MNFYFWSWWSNRNQTYSNQQKTYNIYGAMVYSQTSANKVQWCLRSEKLTRWAFQVSQLTALRVSRSWCREREFRQSLWTPSWGERAESMEAKCLEFPGQNTVEERNTKRTLQIFRGSSLSIHLSSGWPYLRANYPGLGKEPPEKSRSNDTCHIRRLEIVPVPKSKTRKLQNW